MDRQLRTDHVVQQGAWNAFTVTVPTNAQLPLAELGVQFFTSKTRWSGTAYIDNVTWQATPRSS